MYNMYVETAGPGLFLLERLQSIIAMAIVITFYKDICDIKLPSSPQPKDFNLCKFKLLNYHINLNLQSIDEKWIYLTKSVFISVFHKMRNVKVPSSTTLLNRFK